MDSDLAVGRTLVLACLTIIAVVAVIVLDERADSADAVSSVVVWPPDGTRWARDVITGPTPRPQTGGLSLFPAVSAARSARRALAAAAGGLVACALVLFGMCVVQIRFRDRLANWTWARTIREVRKWWRQRAVEVYRARNMSLLDEVNRKFGSAALRLSRLPHLAGALNRQAIPIEHGSWSDDSYVDESTPGSPERAGTQRAVIHWWTNEESNDGTSLLLRGRRRVRRAADQFLREVRKSRSKDPRLRAARELARNPTEAGARTVAHSLLRELNSGSRIRSSKVHRAMLEFLAVMDDPYGRR